MYNFLIQICTDNFPNLLFISISILLGALHGLHFILGEKEANTWVMNAILDIPEQPISITLIKIFQSSFIGLTVLSLIGMAQLLPDVMTKFSVQLGSAILIIGFGIWIIVFNRQRLKLVSQEYLQENVYPLENCKIEIRRIDTGHGVVRFDVMEMSHTVRFRLFSESADEHIWAAEEISVEVSRGNELNQIFGFVQCDGFLESVQEILPPYRFVAKLSLSHLHHTHVFEVPFFKHNSLIDSEKNSDAQKTKHKQSLVETNTVLTQTKANVITYSQFTSLALTRPMLPRSLLIAFMLMSLEIKTFLFGTSLVLCMLLSSMLMTLLSKALSVVRDAKSEYRLSIRYARFETKISHLCAFLMILLGLSASVKSLQIRYDQPNTREQFNTSVYLENDDYCL